MKNDVFVLPDLFTGTSSLPTYVHFYSTDKSTRRNKVILNQNVICFIIQGLKEVVSLGTTLKLDHHQVLLLESGSVLMSESLTENHKYESILFFFSTEYLTNFCISYQIPVGKISGKNNRRAAIYKDDFLTNFQTSVKLLERKQLMDFNNIKLNELLLYLYHNYNLEFVSFLNATISATSDTVIRSVIAAHSADTLSLDELAFLCNMSVSTFKRHFVSLYKNSPKKYFTENKMLKAKQLLQFKKTPSEIYHQLGYESLSSFSNEFKKHFGVSPKQFQKKNDLKEKVFEPLT